MKLTFSKGPFDGQVMHVDAAGVNITEVVVISGDKYRHYQYDPSLEEEQGNPPDRTLYFVEDPFDTHDFLENLVI